MNERPPLDPTVDIPPSGDSLDAGLAAAFEPDSGPPLLAGDSVLKALSAGLPSVPRILLHGETARGGMGAVLKGRDVDLGRDVAVKVLVETHQGKTEMLQRFVEEAQISGQLQHPGITPGRTHYLNPCWGRTCIAENESFSLFLSSASPCGKTT